MVQTGDGGKEEKQRPKKKLRMTTSVQLPVAASGMAPPAAAEEERPAPTPDTNASLATFPTEVQRYMQAEGFAQPTPVQEQ